MPPGSFVRVAPLAPAADCRPCVDGKPFSQAGHPFRASLFMLSPRCSLGVRSQNMMVWRDLRDDAAAVCMHPTRRGWVVMLIGITAWDWVGSVFAFVIFFGIFGFAIRLVLKERNPHAWRRRR